MKALYDKVEKIKITPFIRRISSNCICQFASTLLILFIECLICKRGPCVDRKSKFIDNFKSKLIPYLASWVIIPLTAVFSRHFRIIRWDRVFIMLVLTYILAVMKGSKLF